MRRGLLCNHGYQGRAVKMGGHAFNGSLGFRRFQPATDLTNMKSGLWDPTGAA